MQNPPQKYVPDYDKPKCVTEKRPQTGNGDVIRTRLIFQAVFPAVKKTRNSKGFCEDNLPLQMAEQNLSGRGGTDRAFNSNLRPSQAGIQFIYITNSNTDCGSCARPGSQKH